MFGLKAKLRNSLDYYRFHLPILRNLLDTFELNDYEYAIVGGFVRCVTAYHLLKSDELHDIDVVVDIDSQELEYIFSHYHIKYQKNDFGGYKIFDNTGTFNMYIDIWCLSNHQPFKAFPEKYHNWKGITESSWLTVCGGVYLPQTNKVYIKGLKRAIRKHQVTLRHPEIYFESKNIINKYTIVAKLIDYSLYYKLDINCLKAIAEYLAKHKDNKTLVNYLESHSSRFVIDWNKLIDDDFRVLNDFDVFPVDSKYTFWPPVDPNHTPLG